MSHLKYI